MENSVVKIRYHYYSWADRQGLGTLTNFNSWETSILDKQNFVFSELLNFKGNLGGRTKFSYKGKPYYL